MGITIVVVSIPEGLPLALTVAMAYSVLRMKEENIFVRHLRGCEIMGAATYILSDKTGTLTQNKMKVSQAYFFDEEFVNIDTALISNNKKTLIAEVLSRNTTAYLKKSKSKVEFIGNKTEGALLELLEN